jgi:NAD(P)-dependent dehydrogenase (short-subunit alcohol dehydrogenase family)
MHNKTVIVTGAAAGIGLATSLLFAKAGARVLALDRNPAIIDIGREIPDFTGIQCDLTDSAEIRTSLNNLGTDNIDVLINNAGINPSPSSLPDTSETVWHKILETNLTGTYSITKAVLERMNRGTIINISSILALSGARKNAAYAATKGAIVSLTRAMARDHGPAIRVNCVCPGAVQTDMFEEYLNRCDDREQERERIRRSLPLQRLGKPEDIAEAVFFLSSDSASWITGQVLVVDGGDSA